jgi:serine/threonine-protein kinase
MPDQIGPYEVRGTLGRGAMGVVYDGWDKALRRRVAIKTFRLSDTEIDEETQEALARFRRGAEAAGRLNHANIVAVHHSGDSGGLAYIAMEFVAGRSLKQVLDTETRLQPDRVAHIMKQVLAGLGYSHAQGVVHRDVKPANVMLTDDDVVKLADFGIARIASTSATAAGVIMGTPAYMPAEQFLGEIADERSDIYAAGSMLFHLLTGTRPYEGDFAKVMSNVLNAKTPPMPSKRIPALPEAWDSVIGKAMARWPGDRYQTAQEFSRAISAAGDETTVLSPVVDTPAPIQARPVLVARLTSAVALVGLVGLVTLFLRHLHQISEPRGPTLPALQTHIQASTMPPPPLPPQVRNQIESAFAKIDCTSIDVKLVGGSLRLAGFSGDGPERDAIGMALEKVAIPVSGVVLPFPHLYCPVVNVLRPYIQYDPQNFSLGSPPGPNGTWRSEDGYFPKIAGFPFGAWLQIVYLSNDDTASPLFPRASKKDPSVIVEKPEFFRAGSSLELFRPPHARVHPTFPYGTDMFIVVVSPSKVFAGLWPKFKTIADYASALQAAIDTATRNGDPVSASIAVVQTAEK